MQAYKIDLDGGAYGDGKTVISFLTILETILLGGIGDTTSEIIKASSIYDKLQINKTSKTEGKYWWADEADFNFIKHCAEKHTWGRPETVNPVLTKLEIAKFCQKLLDTKIEQIPGT